ncbi:hypothetical protein OS493_030369 [Desmophyllum pertusum]|uniref:HECT domain-containing protein n=1 Tax=Desmophyllum pertusum TaxID=174260 RepID=A0A9W9Z9C1_9CNID|nr:hypothetical protein OS493_030369 [Desmophyllum pertusum]
MAANEQEGRVSRSSGGNSSTSASAFSEAVNLLERSVSLLRESPLSNIMPLANDDIDNTREERAVANYRRIYPGPSRTQAVGQAVSGQRSSARPTTSAIYPGPSGTQAVGQSVSGQRASARPTTSANRSLSSWWPSAGPVPRPSSSGKKSTFRFQPYKVKETWTHEFCVLADKDQRQTPSTAMKQQLREVGLGQRRIVFTNKKGDFKHIQEGLYNNFPKLREAGGFELYRQQDGKSLCYITPPASGYTIPFLKYTYGIKSAILYVLPIQRSLSMDPVPLDEEEVDDSCVQTQECYQCGIDVPLRNLREHLNTCSCGADPVDKVEDVDSPKVNCVNCYLALPMTQIKEHQAECTGGPCNMQPSNAHQSSDDWDTQQDLPNKRPDPTDSTESDPIKALQGLFPDLPITEVEQALCKELGDVNKAAESLMQGDGMPLIDLTVSIWDEDIMVVGKRDVQLSAILVELGTNLTGLPKRISVDQNDILADVIPLYKDAKFDPRQPLRVVFKDQPAIDSGGPRKELYSLVYDRLINSTDYRLFEGQAGRLMPFYNASTVFSGMMRTLGKMIAHSVVQCGIGLPVFSPVCYWYLITGDVSKALPYANLTDVRDPDAAVLTERILLAETTEEISAINADPGFQVMLSDVGCTFQLTTANRTDIVQSIFMHFVLSKKKVLLDQLREGLETLGVLHQAIKHPLLFEELFVRTESDLNSEEVKSILRFPVQMDNGALEMRAMLINFLDDCPTNGLQDFLRFTTGTATLPMPGSFIDKITVTFDAVDDCIFSSTCLLTLQLPPKTENYEVFKMP